MGVASTDEIVSKNNTGVITLGVAPLYGSCLDLLFIRIRVYFSNKTLISLKPTNIFKLYFLHVVRSKIDLFDFNGSSFSYNLLTASSIVLTQNCNILQTMKILKKGCFVDKMSQRMTKWKTPKSTKLGSNNTITCLIHLIRRKFSCRGSNNIVNSESGSAVERRDDQYHFNAVKDNVSQSDLATNVIELSSRIEHYPVTLSSTNQQKDTAEDTTVLNACHKDSVCTSEVAVLEGKLDKSAENSFSDNSFAVVAAIENLGRFNTGDNYKMEAVFGETTTENIIDKTVSDTPYICKEEQCFGLSKLTPTETWKANALLPCMHENFNLYFAFQRMYHKNTVTSTSSVTSRFGECSPPDSSSFKTYSLKEPRAAAVAPDHMCGCNGITKTVSTKVPDVISLAVGKQCIDHQSSNSNTNAAMSANKGTGAEKEYLEKLHEYTLFSLSEAEINDVQKSVEFIVHRLLYKVGEEDSRFYVREVMPNGSFYDGTKICRPDEFDYLAVIEKLSNSCVNVSRDRNHNEGFAHVQLDGSLSLEWDDLCTNGVLHCVKQHDLSSFRDQFRILFNETLRKETVDKINMKVHNLSGVLLVSGLNVSIHGPECTVTARWHSKTTMTSFPITVDICPAIKADCVSAITEKRESLFESAYYSMLQNERYFLIPSDSRSCSFCFKLAFADSDRSLVTGLNETHRKCFRILKLLFREATCADYKMHRVLNSFGLKMAILWHADCCVNSPMRSCVTEVLTYLRETISLKEPYLPNVHLQTRNIWRNLDVTKDGDKKAVAAVVKLLDKLIGIFTDTTLADELHKDRLLKYVRAFVRSC